MRNNIVYILDICVYAFLQGKGGRAIENGKLRADPLR
jgi:hypothetical protein